MVSPSPTQSAPTEDHRPRVAAERRERTRAKLIACALAVIAQRGLEPGVIDEVITAAGVARGTFYNYFRTHEALWAGVAEAVSNEIVRVIDPLVLRHRDPAARVAAGLRYALQLARTYPLFAGFVIHGGVSAIRQGGQATQNIMRDIDAGIAAGRFAPLPAALILDLVLGPVVAAFASVQADDTPRDYPEQFAQAVLQALGVPRAAAQRYATRELAPIEIPASSLLAHVRKNADATSSRSRRPSNK